MAFQKAVLLTAVLALGACTSADRFGNGSGAGGAGAVGGAGSVSDPTSPAYFNATIGDRVLFEVDQSTLTPSAQVTLDGQADWLMANGAYSALIEGHADEQGTREYNLALGERRASVVKDYLESLGVDAARIETVSYGKERPIAGGNDAQSWAQNRNGFTQLVSGVSG